MCIRLDGRLDTAYYGLTIAHATQRSFAWRQLCHGMETGLISFIYRTPSRKKGSVTTFTGPIYMGCFLIEEHFWRYTLVTLLSSVCLANLTVLLAKTLILH